LTLTLAPRRQAPALGPRGEAPPYRSRSLHPRSGEGSGCSDLRRARRRRRGNRRSRRPLRIATRRLRAPGPRDRRLPDGRRPARLPAGSTGTFRRRVATVSGGATRFHGRGFPSRSPTCGLVGWRRSRPRGLIVDLIQTGAHWRGQLEGAVLFRRRA
jgi:hypothetical protein